MHLNCRWRTFRNRVLAPATRERRIYLQSADGSPSEKNGVYFGTDQESLLGVFQDSAEGRDRRLDELIISGS